jgi:tRNA nucleotidyltransferase/poly(A) polymerase
MIRLNAKDAMRRDLTINALFYNINEDKIEDFTGVARDHVLRRTNAKWCLQSMD